MGWLQIRMITCSRCDTRCYGVHNDYSTIPQKLTVLMTCPHPLTQVLLVGDSAVGKSCLLMRFTADRFDEVTTSTIGKHRLAQQWACCCYGNAELLLHACRCGLPGQVLDDKWQAGQAGSLVGRQDLSTRQRSRLPKKQCSTCPRLASLFNPMRCVWRP